MVNAILMNIADNPTNVQLPGMYNEKNPHVPIIVTGHMENFYWAPTWEDRTGVCFGIFRTDNVPQEDIIKLVDTFPGQSIDFFGALKARVYDDESKMTLKELLEYGNMLVQELDNVKRVQLADKYLKEGAIGDANDDATKK
ncbi:hypothetical protein DITRI_Ditri12bG0169500 [Diplodiscus trichospermus]